LKSGGGASLRRRDKHDVQMREDMNFFDQLLARLRGRRGQSMAEYALVLAGVAVVVLFTGYQSLATILVDTLNTVVGLF
jgi:Flp pilus assembly pilin Flp